MNSRTIVGVDVDGVLADLITPALAAASAMLGREILPDHLKEWDLEVLFESKEQSEVFWKNLGAADNRFHGKLQPYEGAAAGMRGLTDYFDVYIVTSPLSSSPTWTHDRDRWIEEKFGIGHHKIIHTSSKHMVSCDILVDDKPENLRRWYAEQMRIRAGKRADPLPVLWKQPWNHIAHGLDRVPFVHTDSWSRVIQLAYGRLQF